MAWKPADSGIEFQVRGRYVDFFDGLRIVGGSVSGKLALGGSSGEGLSLALGSEWGDPDGGDEMWKSSLRDLASDGTAAPVFRADTRYGFGRQGGWSRESYATLRRSSEGGWALGTRGGMRFERDIDRSTGRMEVDFYIDRDSDAGVRFGVCLGCNG